MQALLYHGPRDVRLQQVPELRPGDGQVLVRVGAAGICGSDLHWYRGHRTVAFENRVFGHEVAGTVVRLGAGVDCLRVGDRVGVEPLIGCGRCAGCRAGQYHVCPELRHIGFYYSGGFAEYTVVPAEKAFVLPDHVSFEAAAMLDGFAVAVHALRRLPVSPREIVAVVGAGTVGLQTVQAVRDAGARRVLVSAAHAAQAEAARRIGADVVIDARAEDPAGAVLTATGGAGADTVFETVGGGAAPLQQACAMAARGGRVGVVGVFPRPVEFDVSTPLRRELDLIFCFSYSTWRGVSEYQLALDLLAAGRFDAGPIVTHRYSLAEGAAGFAAADNKKDSGAIKVVLQP